MKLKPLSNNIIIEPIEEDKITETGIFLPETAEKEKPQKGKVIAVGPGKLNNEGKRIPLGVEVGDIVFFQEYGPRVPFTVSANLFIPLNKPSLAFD